MIREKKKIDLNKILIILFIVASIVGLLYDANAQGNRIRDKATETTLTGTELLGIDRTDYADGPIKKISTLAFKNYVISGLSIHNSTIAGFATSGWLEGQVLKFNSSGVLVPSNDATGGTGGGAEYFNDLLDVNTSGIVTNQIMKYNGTTHVPWTINLENVRQMGSTFNGPVYFDDGYFDGDVTFENEIIIPADAASGYVLTSNASGSATWQTLPVKGVLSGTGIWIASGGTGLPRPEFKPSTIPAIADPIAANIKFPVDYVGDPKLIPFDEMSSMIKADQTYMSIYPEETTIMVPDVLSTLDFCTINVTLTDGEGDVIPIAYADASDFALSGTYCTPYFDDVDENQYKFCVYQFTQVPLWPETTTVTVTHTPSGVSQTWYVSWWGGSSGGGIVGLDPEEIPGDRIADGSIGTVKIIDDAITTAKIADDAVTADQIQDRSIGYAKMDLNSVDEDNIVSGAITLSKLDNTVSAKLVYFVDSWPTSQTEGLYFKMGEGLRYYYVEKGSCSFGYQSFDGQSGACLQTKTP